MAGNVVWIVLREGEKLKTRRFLRTNEGILIEKCHVGANFEVWGNFSDVTCARPPKQDQRETNFEALKQKFLENIQQNLLSQRLLTNDSIKLD